MAFADRLRRRREELGLSRAELGALLGLSASAISNYETGISFPKEQALLRLFGALTTDPYTLFQDHFSAKAHVLSRAEREMLTRWRSLSPKGRETVSQLCDTLCAYQTEAAAPAEPRVIPLYHSSAAAGYAAPVFGEDFDYIPVEKDVPPGAEFAVRIQGDSMEPLIEDGEVVYVNHDPLRSGDVGIFWVDGDMLCKQYHKDGAGIVYLFSLNRRRADADVVLTPSGGRRLACFGRVMVHNQMLPSL